LLADPQVAWEVLVQVQEVAKQGEAGEALVQMMVLID
jgi:hypothetical protein